MRSALLIANAGAGSSDEAQIRVAVDRLRREGVDVLVATTEGPDDLDTILGQRGERDVIIAGGDGSLHTVVAALARKDELAAVAVGLIPLGTGNDFARGVGIPLDPDDAALVCAHGVPRRLDLMVVDDHDEVVVNAVNIGVGADASRRAAAFKRRLGRVGYLLGAIGAGLTANGLHLRVLADDEVIADGSRRVLQVGIGNGPFVGGGTPLTPDALLNDGRVDVVVSFAVGPLRRFSYAFGVRLRSHLQRRDVATARAAVVHVSGDEYWCSADGELAGPLTDRTWGVRPRALTMILPAET